MDKYKKQKNFSRNWYKKERRRYFENFDPSKIVVNKTLYKNIQPFSSEKRKVANNVMLVGKMDKIIPEDSLSQKK